MPKSTTTKGAEKNLPNENETTKAKLPERRILVGQIVSLTPLNPQLHSDALFVATQGEDQRHLWAYLPWGPFSDRTSFDSYLHQNAISEDPLFYAITNNVSGMAVGYAAYMRIEPIHRVIEVGSILFTPRLQRTVGATEAMYLMAKYAFEALGYRRYEWKCNAMNAPSRQAALRLGFTFEGIFRQHMIVKGCNRDTAWYSMLDTEWPMRKAVFERWLDPSNFDTQGRQKIALRALVECPE